MNTSVATIIEPSEKPMVVLGNQLEEMGDKWRQALPLHIPVERFKRVVMTAIQHNPQLVFADRYSLWTSATKAAQDGLLPDGREGALVIFKTKVKGKNDKGQDVERWIDAVQWMPMIAGIRKKVRNSGEIADWNVRVVYQKDTFAYRLGDDEVIKHEPYMGTEEPGEVIAAYSIARLKSGEVSREVMTRRQIDRVRLVSKSKDGPAWTQWFDEMARKTVARRHSKVLPMSTDLDDLIRRDDALYDFDDPGKRGKTPARPTLAEFMKPVPGQGQQQQAAEQPSPPPQEMTHASAYELGVEHRNASEEAILPGNLAEEFHDAFLEGFRTRDAELSQQ